MFGFLRKKKPPSERDGLFEDLRRASGELESADQGTRIEVGMTVNIAHTAFAETFKDPRGFRAVPREQQLEYMAKVKAAQDLAHAEHNSKAALGFGLFNIWLCALITNDDELIAQVEPPLATLSEEANAIQAAL